MIGLFPLVSDQSIGDHSQFIVLSLVTSQDLEMTCPKVEEPNLPEGGFMDQVVLNCTNNNLYGKIFYTCIAGTWIIKEECRTYYWGMNNHSRMQI